MSYKNYPYVIEAKRNQHDRKLKHCICGGHSAKDVKKNLNHNSTLKRFWIRLERRFKVKIRKVEVEG